MEFGFVAAGVVTWKRLTDHRSGWFAWLAISRFESSAISLPDYPIGEAGSVAAIVSLAGRSN